MDAFKRHEPMFHTVFYRKYPPWVLDDAKQEALLALYRKWLKNQSILEQSSAYVVQAGIYGVSNWRQKGMRVRGNEGALLVDGQGKVIGEPRSHGHERWTCQQWEYKSGKQGNGKSPKHRIDCSFSRPIGEEQDAQSGGLSGD